MIKLYMERAKDSYIARELALLRASHPQPPIVSHMDKANGSTIEEAVHRMIAAGAPERTATLSNATATFPPALSLSTSIHATDSVGPGSTDCEPSTPAPQTPPPSALSSPSDTEVHSAVFSATDSVSHVPTDCELSMSPSRGSPTAVTALSPLLPSTTASSFLANKPLCSVVRRKHHLLPRRPAHGCENCQFLLAELRVPRQLLECEIERNDELKQLHSSTMRTNVYHCAMSNYLFTCNSVKLVNDFKGHVEGANPLRKVKENAKQRATHVFHFLHFMANSPNPNGNLLFLQDISRVRGQVKAIKHAQFIEEAPKHIDAALGDWQSPKNGTEEEDSEEEEEEEEGSVKQRVPQPCKKEFLPSASPRLMVSSSDNEGSGDWQPPKNGTEEEDSEKEEEETSVKQMVPQLQKKRPAPTPRNRLMIQVYVSPATANILAKHSQNVGVKTKSETERSHHKRRRERPVRR
ncbi:hypothetical protein PAMP_001070 [Pampus punctatissimus]